MADVLVSSDNKLTEDESDNEYTNDETPKPFTEAGKCDDEVTLEFDNKKSLFISRNFLRYSSPVFEAMFNDEFKEKQQNSVQVPGKNYDDFLTFLMCIHPAVLNPVDESNVLCLAAIAEEYQVASIQNACTEFMKSWLKASVENARNSGYYLYHAQPLRDCLHILTTASMLNYEDVITLAVTTVAKFGHVLYNRLNKHPDLMVTGRYVDQPSFMTKVNDETIGDIIKECITLFGNLPATIQCRILSERLMLWGDYDLK